MNARKLCDARNDIEGNNMDIEIFANEWYEPHRRKIVWFSAIVDDKSIECGISIDALVDHFGAFGKHGLLASIGRHDAATPHKKRLHAP